MLGCTCNSDSCHSGNVADEAPESTLTPLLILCQIAGPQFSVLWLRHNKDIYCLRPAHIFRRAAVVSSAWNRGSVPQPQHTGMTFKWAGSKVVALWLMSQEVNSILIEDHPYSPRASFFWCHQRLETQPKTQLCSFVSTLHWACRAEWLKTKFSKQHVSQQISSTGSTVFQPNGWGGRKWTS